MTSTRTTRILITGAVGLAGIGLGATLGPAAAGAATTTTTQAVQGRVSAIKDALAGLVKDGTLTQKQADKVAGTLAEKMPGRGQGGFGPGGRGPGGFGPGDHGPGGHGLGRGVDLSVAAQALGMSLEELHTALESGKTLAQVAQAEGVDQAELVSKLVEAAKARLAEAVKAGRITQEQAERMASGLKQRITDQLTKPRHGGGPGRHGGLGRHGGPATTSPTAPPTAAPTTAPSTTS